MSTKEESAFRDELDVIGRLVGFEVTVIELNLFENIMNLIERGIKN
jgi:hypothetical protein